MATRPNDSTPATARPDWTLCTVHSWPKKLGSQQADATNADADAVAVAVADADRARDREGDNETASETPLVLSCLKLIKDSSTYFISTPTGCRATRTGKCGKPKVAVDRNVDNIAVDRGRCCCGCDCCLGDRSGLLKIGLSLSHAVRGAGRGGRGMFSKCVYRCCLCVCFFFFCFSFLLQFLTSSLKMFDNFSFL